MDSANGREPIPKSTGLQINGAGNSLTKRHPAGKPENGIASGNTNQAHHAHSAEERKRLWKAAIKVPMYTVALSPTLVGTACVYYDTGMFSLFKMTLILLTSVCLIAWVNLSNDVFDTDTGIDKNKKESVVNLLGGDRKARNKTYLVANVFLLVGILSILRLCYDDTKEWSLERISSLSSYDFTSVALWATSIMLGYMYQGPPFRLGYLGLGEPICFSAWFVGISAMYYLQCSPVMVKSSLHGFSYLIFIVLSLKNSLCISASLVSLVTTIILFCSHFHQEADDLAAGKRSPIVRLGTYRASQVLVVMCVALYIIAVAGWYLNQLPWIALLLISLTLPNAWKLIAFGRANYMEPERIRPLKYYAVVLNFWFSVALCLGLAAGRWMKL
eukprot:CAMPEP_0184694248 /NCGR_PEP_ID=MMETSP0313-20130426/2271_1 /TAXON_ID=2792 /ORGANISM="Porphyridium aerugineum, Strain SAG 1380-2" /LENGTH=386 /DNA_ID=CAMNT_0027152509 /DNA_START=111 /DNA_END=1271 /DNA_ORIENTATION=-